jgi:hypothetical protein
MKKVIWILLPFVLVACNLPLTKKITPTPNITQAYQTVIAQVNTMQAGATLGTSVPSSTITVALTPLSTQVFPTLPAQTALPLPTSIPTQVCDRVLPGNPLDMTIPDDSILQGGSTFTKIWRLQNGGACAWTTDYSIVWISGELITDQKSYPMPINVQAGRSVDVSIDMTAPEDAGTYQSNWMLENADGTYFGIGPTGKSPFWVKFIVQPAQTPSPTPTATTTPVPSHGVIYTGISTLQSGQSIDITSGSIVSGEDLDLAFSSSTMKGMNGATISDALSSQPSYSTCAAQSITATSIQLSDATLYKYFCMKDNQGHIGSAQLLAFTAGANLTLEINTWSSN